MATPPRVTATEAAAAAERIVRRHEHVDDDQRERMGSDPRDVLDYLIRQGGRGLPEWVVRADVLDATVLHVWLRWEDRRRELALLRLGRRYGLTLVQLGALYGIRTAQGVRDLIDRLAALLAYDRPDEKLSRQARRVAPVPGDPRERWVDKHREQLHEVATGLLVAAERFRVTEREWLDELDSDTVSGYSPGSMGVLGMAAAEVRTAPLVAGLTEPDEVHQLLRRAEALRAEFTRLTATAA